MKTRMVVVMVTGIALLFAGVALAGISSTKHNLSTSGTGTYKSTDTGEICVFCHTPHTANTANGPLWNRTAPNGGNNFTLYGQTLAGTSPTQPNTVSKACLSCHDGITGLNAITNKIGLGGSVPTMNTNTISGEANIGNSLADDHPISIVYTETTKANLRALTVDAAYTVVKVIDGSTVKGAASGTSTVECSSCHDPHISTTSSFLRIANTGSALCLTCHQK